MDLSPIMKANMIRGGSRMTTNIPRREYPRPQFVRDTWLNLNGEWEFEFDDQNLGERDQWYRGDRSFTRRIQVPFAFESKLSGIHETDFHDRVWYRRTFTLPQEFA